MERALLVNVHLRDLPYRSSWPAEEVSAEFQELARSSGLKVVAEMAVGRDRPTAACLIGKGKAEEIRAQCQEGKAEVAVFSRDLTFAQQRNLEDLLGLKVIDRTQLILDIFAQRARSREGCVQVELAQLEYLLPRLAGKGILLSRLGGGIGTRGPGEQKLELDRRRIRLRISRLGGELSGIRRRREIARQRREKEDIPTVAVIGYTNAGKSTLLNALTQAGTRAENRLFTTLDPLIRRVHLPGHQQVLLTDTVGFLHELPHHLVDAFRATLEEVTQSDFLLHVLDASSQMMEEKATAVYEVLTSLKAQDKPILTVLNKMDCLSQEERRSLRRRYPEAVLVSALTREGLAELLDRLMGILRQGMVEAVVSIPPTERSWLDRIYREGQVLQRQEKEEETQIRVRLPSRLYGQLSKAGLIR